MFIFSLGAFELALILVPCVDTPRSFYRGVGAMPGKCFRPAPATRQGGGSFRGGDVGSWDNRWRADIAVPLHLLGGRSKPQAMLRDNIVRDFKLYVLVYRLYSLAIY